MSDTHAHTHNQPKLSLKFSKSQKGWKKRAKGCVIKRADIKLIINAIKLRENKRATLMGTDDLFPITFP